MSNSSTNLTIPIITEILKKKYCSLTTPKSRIYDANERLGNLSACPLIPPHLKGTIKIDTTFESLESVEDKYRGCLLPGGWYKPKECNSNNRVAIVIPYRDRGTQLPVFLKNLHPFLMRQQIEYGIFVVEQVLGVLFNRATLKNIGYVEAMKLKQWDCFIFHDVDLIPIDDRNLYTCPPNNASRHMAVNYDLLHYK